MMRPGLMFLEQKLGTRVALAGVIAGGGPYDTLGIFLNYNPADFGLEVVSDRLPSIKLMVRCERASAQPSTATPLTRGMTSGGSRSCRRIRPGSWTSSRRVSRPKQYPAQRHFLWTQAEESVYRLRDSPGALDLFDQACGEHDSEMSTISPALIDVFGGLPLLEVYKQASIRHQKAHDWERADWWARRGLEVYGASALDPANVSDLSERVAKIAARVDREQHAVARTPPRAAGQHQRTVDVHTGAHLHGVRGRLGTAASSRAPPEVVPDLPSDRLDANVSTVTLRAKHAFAPPADRVAAAPPVPAPDRSPSRPGQPRRPREARRSARGCRATFRPSGRESPRHESTVC